VVSDQFRAGNVPSGFGVADYVRSSIEALPPGIETMDFRGDSAAYDWKLMNYLRRSAIRFAITADSYPLKDRRGEELPGQARLDFPETAEEFRTRYRVIATKREEPGDQILIWAGERCGSIERVFRTMYNDQAAATPPCGRFGANAAWYRYNVLLFNLLQGMRLLVLPDALCRRSLKVLRLRLLRLAGRVVRGASRIWKLKVQAEGAALGWIQETCQRLQALAEQVPLLPLCAAG